MAGTPPEKKPRLTATQINRRVLELRNAVLSEHRPAEGGGKEQHYEAVARAEAAAERARKDLAG